jgi:uncharacterized protein (DUF736 family)
MARDIRTNVGKLKVLTTRPKAGGSPIFSAIGVFLTLTARYDIQMDPIERAEDAPPATDDTPTHKITMRGGSAEIGVAWMREITKGEHEGEPMFSIALNHPDLPEWAANLAAFPRSKNGDYEIQHQRRRAQPVTAAAEAGGKGGASADVDDEIPF